MIENDADIRWDILMSTRDGATRFQVRAYCTRVFRNPSQEAQDYHARFDAAERLFLKTWEGKYA